MREEDRAGDVYAWSWPARPVGDDAYQWRGPVPMAQVSEGRPLAQPPALGPVAQPPAAVFPAVAETIEFTQPEAIGVADPGIDVWVELPAPTDRPARTRRRGRGKAAAPEAVEPEPTETVTLEGAPLSVATPIPPPEPESEPEPVAPAPLVETPALVLETVAPHREASTTLAETAAPEDRMSRSSRK